MKSQKYGLIVAVTVIITAAFGLSFAEPPVLKIDGKTNPDVYLQSLDIQVEVTGNIASTRYTMVFKNRTNRILEGELTFPLPDERSVTYYALDINGKMREAVPVEKAKGTEVFEEIEQRRIDPGLLERVEGSNFRTRIYPIPANKTRTVAIGYEEELPLENQSLHYRLPMAYPDSIEKFTVKATVWKSGVKPIIADSADEFRFDKVGENYVASFSRENYRPDRALNFALPAPADIPRVMMQSAQGSYYFFASVAPALETRKKQWNGDLAIIWDVSLSGSQRDLKRELEMLNIIFAEKKEVDVHLYFLNNRFKKIANVSTSNGEYKVSDGNWDELKSVLEAAVFDGGTDFSQIDLNDIAGNEILFFSDGISTLSNADFLKKTKANRPIHCIVSSAKADYSAMKLISGKTKSKFVNANALSPENLKNELLNETLQFLGAEYGKAIREVYPSIAAPIHGNFSIAGVSNADNAELTLLFGFGTAVEKRIKVKLEAKSAGTRVNVHKIWAQKKIAELDLDYDGNRADLTELGRQFGIVTRNTSLIVLETVEDYILYNIQPPAELRAEYQRRLSKSGLQKRDLDDLFGGLRGGVSSTGTPRGNRTSSSDIFDRGGFAADIDRLLSGVGGLKSGGDSRVGRKGTAGIGYGASYGSGFGGGGGGIDDLLGGLMSGNGGGLELKKKGELRVSNPDFLKGGALTGGRSRASIQRVISQNMAALRFAYNKRLREKPGLTGKITVKFAIDESGKVIFANKVESTMGDPELESTVISRLKSWNFERIDKPGDVTEITYPFVFSQDGPSGSWGGSSQTSERTSRAEERASRSTERSSLTDERSSQTREEYRDSDTLNGALTAAKNLRQWWNTDFTPKMPKYPIPDEERSDTGSAAKDNLIRNADYLKKMTGNTTDDYPIYLDARKGYANSPAFYFDMANWFYALGDKETALRILTSIADLELENASLYRLLGYRLKEYGEYAIEKFVCQKVVLWRPMEPQSYRDCALALADNEEPQAALDSLYGLLKKNYSENIRRRSRGIEEVAVTEINRLIAKNANLNKSKIHKQALINIPVDVRVVINWNMNSTDIDLHVFDPNGEECSYKNRKTSIGGRMSADIRNGYGPEQFLLKNAVKGKYRVCVNYFSDSQVTNAGPATVMAEIYTKYADKTEHRKVVCLQMSNAVKKMDGKYVDVAEFDF